MSESFQATRLKQNQLESAIKVMVKAFYHDPFVVYLAPDEALRARVLPAFIGIVINYSFLYGEVWTTPSLSGLACWLVPGKTSATFMGMLRTGMFIVPLKFGWAGFKRFNDVISYTDIIHKQIITEAHWYLWGLGVDPAHQREGNGARLMLPILERADSMGQACYLETQNRANLPFYTKHGFEVASDGKSPGGLQVWAMVRKAR